MLDQAKDRRVEPAGKPGRASPARQVAFARVAALPGAALVVGVAGGFALATVLTVTAALGVPQGAWWQATAQAHGHLQLYGWAGLFALGVGLHFMPRLRGSPLAGATWAPLIAAALVVGLALRAVAQPLLAAGGWTGWRVAYAASGWVELVALGGAVGMLAATFARGPALATRRAFTGVLPLLAVSGVALCLAAAVNVVNVTMPGGVPGLITGPGDDLNVTLGLFGFLVPLALAMSAQALPLYAGLTAFPRPVLWSVTAAYTAGLALWCASLPGAGAAWTPLAQGIGLVLLGGALLAFLGVCGRMMRTRGRIPQRVSALSPRPEHLAQAYSRQVAEHRGAYGPFVAIIGTAYGWAGIGALFLAVDGVAQLVAAGGQPIPTDAARHSFTMGFIALLIAGIAPRMLPGFSHGRIRSAGYVTATLWLGNAAALLRVAGVILLAAGGGGVSALGTTLFGLSGPLGLAFAACLALNLWPAIFPPNVGKATAGA